MLSCSASATAAESRDNLFYSAAAGFRFHIYSIRTAFFRRLQPDFFFALKGQCIRMSPVEYPKRKDASDAMLMVIAKTPIL